MREALSDFKLQTGYLKYRRDLGRKEVWEEAVDRVIGMHETKYAEELKDDIIRSYLEDARQAYYDKLVLASQRSLQFGGEPILKKNSKMYNCLTSYCDRVPFFRESMWWLLSGCGVGFSVLPQYIEQLPTLKARTLGTKTFVVEDSIEGWADALGVLLASYFGEGDDKFRDYYGYIVHFDVSQIRKKGAPISSGFKAPGPEPLVRALEKIEILIENWMKTQGSVVRGILAYDIEMHASNAVLSGGVRRSATICIFGKDDLEMRNAKTGNWYVDNPQRARSNNSVALLKGETSYEEFKEIMKSVEQYGEPGFVWLDDLRIVYNPCVEIGMVPALKQIISGEVLPPDGYEFWESGWQGCNLTEINGAKCTTKEIFFRACRASAILGTFQAGYTDFEYVGRVTEEIFRKEALLGCSITGWMNNPDILFDEQTLREGAEIIRLINEDLAPRLGINPAARRTCSKPSGNSAVILGSESGMKTAEGKRFIRYVQVNPDEYGVKHFVELNPELVEHSVWDEGGQDLVIGFAIECPPGTIFKRDVYGVKHLEYVKKAVRSWVEPGTTVERCTLPCVRHNVSATINVDDWDSVGDYIYENRQHFAGISLLGMSGSLEYNQAPFTEVLSLEELGEKYGDAVAMASGLIVDGLHAFDNDLWLACMSVAEKSIKIEGTRTQVFLKKEWIRRAKKFSKNYFRSNVRAMTNCLKDVHRFYRFNTIRKNYRAVDWEHYYEASEDVEVASLGAISCNGDVCTINV